MTESDREGVMILIRNLYPATWSLAREEAPSVPLTEADIRAILGERIPAMGWAPVDPGAPVGFARSEDGLRAAMAVRDQLNDAIAEGAEPEPLPGEDFPECGYLATSAGDQPGPDFAEPAGGEGPRVAAEEAAVARSLAADEVLWWGWRPNDRFKVGGEAGEKLAAALALLCPPHADIVGGKCFGHVITRCQLHTAGVIAWALLIDYDGAPCPVVVPADYLGLCASRVRA